MRILQIGKYYPPAKGGMETVLAAITDGLLARGDEVDVLVAGEARRTIRRPLPAPGGGSGELVRCGVAATLASQPLMPDLAAELRRLLRRRPDVVTLHWPNPLAAAALLASARGPGAGRLTVWYHADITRQRLGAALLRPLVRRLLARCDGVAVSSASLRDQSPLLAPHAARTAVIPFGIDPGPWRVGTHPGRGPLLFVGRLVYYKGIEVLLEAVARLPGAQLDIVGDGPLRARLAARAAQPDLAGRVRLRGELDDGALRSVMSGAAGLVLPSLLRAETFGLVQLEAMAAGLPVVATRLPTGVAEVTVHGETGWLVTPGDPAALTAALAELLADPVEAARRGEAGRRRVESRFHRDRMVAELADWYARLMDRTGGGKRGL
ncbi:MAG: glycosyltransferase [bacterium]|nr:glycosyltransferase [bacterium]